MPYHMFRDMPIKRRLVVITTLISAMALTLGCLGIFANMQFESREDLLGETRTDASILGDAVAEALALDDTPAAEQSLQLLAGDPNIDGAAVYRPDGRVVAVYRNVHSEEGRAFSPPPPELAETYWWGENSLHVFSAITVARQQTGTILVVSDLDDVYSRDWRYVAIAGSVIVGASIVAFFMSGWLLAPISDPLAHLAEVVGTVAATRDYAVRAVKQGDDEAGRLIDGFNEMLIQIQLRDIALEAARSDLELRVVARTTELRAEIAERKQAEAALRSSEERLSGAFENAAIGMMLTAPEGRIIAANGALCGLLGYAPAELLKRTWQDLTHPGDQAADLEHVGKVLAGEVLSYRMEKRYCHKLGHDVWALLDVSLVRDSSGQPQYFIAQIQDISERRRAELALAESETRLRALLENASDVIAITALDGALKYVSPSIRKVGGYEPEELVGRNFLQLVHPGDQAAATTQFMELIRTPGASQRVERRYLRKDGGWIESDNIAVNLSHVAAIGGVVTTLRDITQRKHDEAELRQAHRQLLEASRLGGMAEVATNVLHNVGNVLNSVNVSANLALDSLRSSRSSSLVKVVALMREHPGDLGNYITSDAKGQYIPAYLEQVAQEWQGQQESLIRELELLRGNIDHIKGIVAMQQNYAKVSGTTEVVDLPQLIEDCLSMNADPMACDLVQVTREFDGVHAVTLEKHKLLQIMLNLVRNARDACHARPGPDKSIILRLEQAAGRVRISVIDNGVGIEPDGLTRIFAHGFTTRRDGHGFGLHSGALAAAEMGGSLSAHSGGPGQGATFVLELPLQPSWARA